MSVLEGEDVSKLSSYVESGLSSEEAAKRLSEYGYNEIPERNVNPLVRFAEKFWGLTPWMLEVTVVLEWLLGKYVEVYVIAGLLVFNAAVSFLEEERANAALSLLKQKLRVNARVKRDAKWKLIPARELVPSDVVRLRAGDFAPADVRVVEGRADVDQSSLTGESLPVERKNGEVIYSGSTVRAGEVTGIVASTGAKTYFGRTVELVQIAKPKLHMEEVVSKVVRWLLILAVAALAIWLALALVQGVDFGELLPLTVILLMSAIPVALPTMFTVSMALGSLELARRGTIITRLDAGEEAAEMDVVCVDKTGTMTMNRLSVADAVAAGKYGKEDVVMYGALASQEANQDPIDLAFLAAAENMQTSLSGYQQKSFTPFDPSTRRTEAVVEKDGQRFLVLKGALNTIVALTSGGQKELVGLSENVEEFSAKGYRVIAVARGAGEREGEGEIELVGIAALYDKPRPDSPKLIAELRSLGVSVKMLTGDALPIAREVASQLGLGSNIIRVSNLKDSLGEEKGSQILEESDGFAEIYPEDKYLIVRGLQARGHIVGMTGDGVNDAPALRQAEVGIAVSNATDVAKRASSVVLTAEGLEGIVDLVKGGRRIYQRIVTWIINKNIRTFKRVFFIVLAFILTGKFVVSTLNMILLLFLSDYVTLSISTDNVRYSEEPERWQITHLVEIGVLYGVLIVAESMLLLYFGFAFFGLDDKVDELHTFIFVWLTLSGYFTVLTVRERRHFWESRPSKALAAALVINSFIVLIISVLGLPDLTPITLVEFLTVLVYAFASCLLVNDAVKTLLSKRLKIVK